MLDQDTKRRIDSARDILVGKVPDPKAQVEQITIALIYKFMDDMDKESEELGGKTRYFTGEYEKYAWSKLLDAKVGGVERMSLYGEAILKMSQNPKLPQLFRDIFKGAFLPYRSPETLNMFLKEINGFVYDHSEKLGDSYEYLLSVLSSQGDAGQFRTPRHIIDFIVNVIDPKKNETILDPACGTAGFLISAYKHILNQNKDKVPGDKLRPDEKARLMHHIVGYDISPDMIRLSLVNMYLHGFKDKEPKIFEYDTLSMEQRWDETYDVVLANPPFMSPKGGIIPHKRFSVQANRSEVLFVDYISEHMNPNGRAGVIVPEGIVFQSANAHKKLRKMLIEQSLYAVVSLPAGVFNPYSGVKTSILFMDKGLAKKTDNILFVKVTNDGFDLGAQRRAVKENDLTQVLEIITKYKQSVIENKKSKLSVDGSNIALIISKEKIAKNGDYNLSGDRYQVATDYTNAKWPMLVLGEVIKICFGERITKNNQQGSKYPVYGGGGESFRTDNFNRENEFVISRFAMSENCVRYVKGQFWLMDSGGTFSINKEYENKLNKDYIGNILLSKQVDIFMCARGGAQKNINVDHFYELKIPLPPLEIQEQIVAELDSYQNIINGARQVVNSWKPKIDIDPEWEKVILGEVCDVRDGTHDSPKQIQKGYPLITSKNIKDGELDFSNVSYISDEDFKKVSQRSYVDIGDIIMPMIGTIGGVCLIKSKEKEFAIKNVALFKKSKQIIPEYLSNILDSDLVTTMFENQAKGATQKFVSLGVLRGLEIPLPPLKTQKQIAEKIEIERALVEANKKLIKTYEQRIKDRIAKVWDK